VVFVHGLGHGSLDTWLSLGYPPEHWPNWLKDDLENVAIWAVLYDAAKTRLWGRAMHLADRAENGLARLVSQPEFQKGELSIVGYSFGGLVVAEAMRAAEAKARNDQRVANFLRNVRRVCFLGTPHRGADMATWVKFLGLASVATRSIPRNDPNLRSLNIWYKHYEKANEVQTLVLIDMHRQLFGGWIVKPDSGDPGFNSDPKYIAADHDMLCHPKDRKAEVYVYIRDFLRAPSTGVHDDTFIASELLQTRSGVEALRQQIAENTRALGELKAQAAPPADCG